MSTDLESIGLNDQDIEDGENRRGGCGSATGWAENLENRGVGPTQPLETLNSGALPGLGLEVGQSSCLGELKRGANKIPGKRVLGGLGQ